MLARIVPDQVFAIKGGINASKQGILNITQFSWQQEIPLKPVATVDRKAGFYTVQIQMHDDLIVSKSTNSRAFIELAANMFKYIPIFLPLF